MSKKLDESLNLYKDLIKVRRVARNIRLALSTNIPKKKATKYKQAIADSVVSLRNAEEKFHNSTRKLSHDDLIELSMKVRY